MGTPKWRSAEEFRRERAMGFEPTTSSLGNRPSHTPVSSENPIFPNTLSTFRLVCKHMRAVSSACENLRNFRRIAGWRGRRAEGSAQRRRGEGGARPRNAQDGGKPPRPAQAASAALTPRNASAGPSGSREGFSERRRRRPASHQSDCRPSHRSVSNAPFLFRHGAFTFRTRRGPSSSGSGSSSAGSSTPSAPATRRPAATPGRPRPGQPRFVSQGPQVPAEAHGMASSGECLGGVPAGLTTRGRRRSW
jgi:hypothetical protein